MATRQDVENLKQEYIDSEFAQPYAHLLSTLSGKGMCNLNYILAGLDALDEAVSETGNMPVFSKRHSGKMADLTSRLKSFRDGDSSEEIMDFRDRRKNKIVNNINLYDEIKAQMPAE